MKSFEIRYTNQSLNELKSIIYNLALYSPAKAKQCKEIFQTAMIHVSTYPDMAPYLEGDYIPKNRYHKLLLKNNYMVIYQIIEQTIWIEHIFSCKQDYQWLV